MNELTHEEGRASLSGHESLGLALTIVFIWPFIHPAKNYGAPITTKYQMYNGGKVLPGRERKLL